MKNLVGWILGVAAIVVIGCGGSGGGGTTSATATTATATTSTATTSTATTSTATTSTGGNFEGVTGQVVLPGNPPFPIRGATVLFYDASKSQIATTTTDANGNFTAALAPTAVYFTINLDAADPAHGLNRQFSYVSKEYLTSNTACLAKLPTLDSTHTVAMSEIDVSSSASPPPPPTGCLG